MILWIYVLKRFVISMYFNVNVFFYVFFITEIHWNKQQIIIQHGIKCPTEFFTFFKKILT